MHNQTLFNVHKLFKIPKRNDRNVSDTVVDISQEPLESLLPPAQGATGADGGDDFKKQGV
jgi:hypothetical protein